MSSAAISVVADAEKCPAWCTGHTEGPENDAVHYSPTASIRLSSEPDPVAIKELGPGFTSSVEVWIRQVRDGVEPGPLSVPGARIELVAPGNWDGPGVSILTAAEARQAGRALLDAADQMEASSGSPRAA